MGPAFEKIAQSTVYVVTLNGMNERRRLLMSEDGGRTAAVGAKQTISSVRAKDR